jgi:hypothetical protein
VEGLPLGLTASPFCWDHEWDILSNETGDSIDRDAKPAADLLLRSSDEAATASTNVMDALAGLELGENQR